MRRNREARESRGRLIDHPMMGWAVSVGKAADAIPVDEATRKNVFFKTIKNLKLGQVGVAVVATAISGPGGAAFNLANGLLQKGGEEALKALKSGATDEKAQKQAMLAMFGAGTAKAATAPVDALMGMLNLTSRGAAAPVVAVATELMKKGLIPATLGAFETVVENYMARATGLDPNRDLKKDAWKSGVGEVIKGLGTGKQ